MGLYSFSNNTNIVKLVIGAILSTSPTIVNATKSLIMITSPYASHAIPSGTKQEYHHRYGSSCSMELTMDGNLVVQGNSDGKWITKWESGSGTGDTSRLYYLHLQLNDGNLVIYEGERNKGGIDTALWSTHTGHKGTEKLYLTDTCDLVLEGSDGQSDWTTAGLSSYPTFYVPTSDPSASLSLSPIISLSEFPTVIPTTLHTASSTLIPSTSPTGYPSTSPAATPTGQPTYVPTITPTFQPTSNTPTFAPSVLQTSYSSLVDVDIDLGTSSEIPTIYGTIVPTPIRSHTSEPMAFSPSTEPTFFIYFPPTASPAASSLPTFSSIPSAISNVPPSMAPSLSTTPTAIQSPVASLGPSLMTSSTVISSSIPTLSSSETPYAARTNNPNDVVSESPSSVTSSDLPTDNLAGSLNQARQAGIGVHSTDFVGEETFLFETP